MYMQMKKLSTKNKILFLQQYVKIWHKEWQKRHPQNIVGFRVGKKVKNGIESRHFSIIFQVVKKKNINKLKSKVQIPESFKIIFPDMKTRIIKTDVEETGKFKFNAGITSAVQSIYSNKFGSAGLFVKDRTNRMFMLTNYHVIADQMIQNGQYYYRRPSSQTQNDVKIILNNSNTLIGRFEEGIISHEVDVAFVEIFSPLQNNMNILPDQNRVFGRVSARPIPPTFVGKQIKVYSCYNRFGNLCFINDNSSVLYTGNNNIHFEDIIQISPKVTRGGDSGGTVVTPSYSILGIIVGCDNNYSYAIPFYKIDDFKNIFII